MNLITKNSSRGPESPTLHPSAVEFSGRRLERQRNVEMCGALGDPIPARDQRPEDHVRHVAFDCIPGQALMLRMFDSRRTLDHVADCECAIMASLFRVTSIDMRFASDSAAHGTNTVTSLTLSEATRRR